jgi:CubicO group peptidase (beta-lactamase class C family)
MRSACFGSVVSIVLLLVGSPSGAADRGYGPTGWPRSEPEHVGLDATVLAALDADIAAGKYAHIDSFDVFRCGRQVYSRTYPHDYGTLYAKEAHERGPLNARLTGPYNYFDPATHPYYQGSDLHSLQSITKTVTSAILGIAIARGDFRASLDTPVLHWFDESRVKNIDARKRHMTLRHVLTMTTGLDWNEENVPYDDPRSDSSNMEATDDWVSYVIDRPMAEEPGRHFNYSSGATELIADIFEKETGEDIESYGRRHLFRPLGIRYHWARTYTGVVDTEGGLYLSGADLAKLGELYRRGGWWHGRRIIPTEWVRESLAPAIDTGYPGDRYDYGYKWWLFHPKGSDRTIPMGRGFGGQRLMVFDDEQMVVTFTGWDMIDDPPPNSVLVERLLAAVRTSSCPSHRH